MVCGHWFFSYFPILSRMYSLVALFFLIPIFFSHSCARMGWIIDNGIWHFESVKMSLFIVLIIVALFEMSFTHRDKLSHLLQQKHIQWWLLLMSFWLFWAIFYYPHENIRDILLWVGEKQHGILLPIWLILLSWLIPLLSHKERTYSMYAILISGCIVSGSALIEAIGYNIFTWTLYLSQWSWWSIRSASTLGNPNYVAGFLLILLPLVMTMKSKWKYIVFLLFLSWLATTQSVIGISLALWYILFLMIDHRSLKHRYTIFMILVFVLCITIYLAYADTDKWLSFTSRFILMKETIHMIMTSVGWLFFGYGPNAIIDFFSVFRPDEIRGYFPDRMIIDSSHNVFIDILAQYGLIIAVSLLYFLIRRYISLSYFARSSLILWVGFLSLNVFVVTHMILLVFVLSLEKKE